MTSTLPKLRTDLDRRVQNEPDGAVLVIKDPLSREFFRLKEAERFIAEQLDGETPLDAVQQRVEEKFGASLAPKVLAGFIKTLDKNRLLERPGARRESRRKQEQKRVAAGGWLNLRFKLLDPEAVLNRLLPWVRFCFTPHFVFVSAALIFIAVAVTAFNWSDILQAAADLYSLSTVPLLIATIFVVVMLHEFAHGLTCKYFGGEVREMGFLLIYLQPAFYCNVSDAWFFPKAQRLWVSFAGPYFELFIWAVATLAWRVTDSDGWINHVALVVMATSGIKTFFNFNPLIKLDGYYLLSDYLGIPNLRKKSFRYLGACLKSLGGVFGNLPAALPRERRIYLTYGIPAAIASIAILTYFAWAIGEHLIMADQRLAFFAFAGLIGMRFRSKVRGLFGRNREPGESSSRSRRKDGDRKSRRGRKWLIAAAVLFLMIVVPLELKVAGSINVLPIHNADVRAEIEGMISEVVVDEGQHVKAGDPIARIVDRDLRAELEKTEALAGESRARLRLLEAGSRPEEIEVAMTTVARHEEQLKYHRGRLDRFRALNEQQLTSMLDYEESARLVASAESDLAEAKKKLDLLLAGTRPEEIEALRGTVASQESQIRHLREQLRLTVVSSPAAGIVTTPSRQLKAMRLQAVAKGDLIAKVQDSKTITAEIAVSEKEIADVRNGHTVALKVRAFPERVFPGKVTDIATTAGDGGASAPSASAPKSGLLPDATGDAGKSANTILVTTEIDNADGLLKPGMTGMAKIYCGKRQIITLMMRRLSRTFRVEFWSWW
ncbi:MAG TPA: efflux RND transporter periplasmic adaptor subunit [Chthoniobacterales bacterium]|nr:efflux RND transporter periplasmic adaptor subunit [Chthoniobacterales bacterium]